MFLRYTAFRSIITLWLLAFALIPCRWAMAAQASGFVTHDLSVQLDTAAQRLNGVDRLVVTNPPERLQFFLAPRAHIESILIDGRSAPWQRQGGRVILPLGPNRGESLNVEIAYSAIFDDTPPRQPVNTDNPGYGVTGTISEQGTVLLAGAGWYPRVVGLDRSIRLTVTAPAGTLAVTSGRLEGHTTAKGASLSRWHITKPTGALSLSAGPYIMRQKRAGKHVVRTYLTAPNLNLADAYLDASLIYLAQYSERFGPYPFAHFAVVENHYPTGYGFPGWTLIGGRVLRLPFIIPTSLRHEIAHCWWGNGVTVDASQGNWSEGLATYVADYAYRSDQGESVAREYRRELLRNYTSLVAPEEAFPLTRFQSRRDRITKAVGYDKSALVFHMLHQKLGDKFWTALAELYREQLFSAVSRKDLQAYFQRHADSRLDRFFDQWLMRADAPRLRMDGVVYDPAAGLIRGRIEQNRPAYDLSLEIHAGGGGETVSGQITLSGTTTDFSLPFPHSPAWVEADPQAHILRRLWPEEIPATINSLKGAGEVAVVIPSGADAQTRQLADLLPKALGIARKPHSSTPAKAVLWVGSADPEDLPAGVHMDGERLFLHGEPVPSQVDAFFAVWRSEQDAGLRALYWSPDLAQAQRVARKIPHYGKYSYLAFAQAVNTGKGVWPISDSPLRVSLPVAQGDMQ